LGTLKSSEAEFTSLHLNSIFLVELKKFVLQ
jgi:hypothetical protein